MQFSYKRFLVQPTPESKEYRTVLRPVIPIQLIVREQRIGYEALIDSGADYSIFHAEIGEAIGLDIIQGDRTVFSGVAGAGQEGFCHSVYLEVGGEEFLSRVIFCYGLKIPYGILGEEGFFERFRVVFDLSAKQIHMTVRSQ